ncbi:MAG: hypothetical protein KQI35_05515 [Bacteroidetes bacterium]|nr:hypothetical protein [Bacteroidota bacterium]
MERNNYLKKISWINRINGEVYYILIVNSFLAFYNLELFVQNWIKIEISLVSLIILLLFRKNTRLIFEVFFDDANKKLILSYYQFTFLKSQQSIPYEDLKVFFKKKSYGIGNIINALTFYDNKKFIAEIREVNRLGWSKNDLVGFEEKSKKIIFNTLSGASLTAQG